MVPKRDIESGEQTPLLGRPSTINNNNNNNIINNKKELLQKDLEVETIKEKAVAGIAGCGFITSLLSILFESHPSALLSGILGLVLAPYAAFQQQKISQCEALRQTNAQMEEEVQLLSHENDRLQGQLLAIQESVSKLQSLEETLESVQALQGESVTKLEAQVVESREILAGMNRNKQAVVLQNLMTLLIATDADADMILSDQEINDLMHNLEGLHGVQLKEDLIRQVILEQGRSISAVMAVAREALTGSGMFTYLEDNQAGI